MKKPLKFPKFKSAEKEFEYFDKLDITEYFEPSDGKRPLFPNLKLSTRSISIRIPEYIINRVKMNANALDVPYQALMKEYIAKGAFSDNK